MLLFAMEWNEKFGLSDTLNDLELFLTGVAGYMNLIHRLIDHFTTALQEFIDHCPYGLFIARDGARRNDDKILRPYFHFSMIGKSHARQSAHWFPLAARRD